MERSRPVRALKRAPPSSGPSPLTVLVLSSHPSRFSPTATGYDASLTRLSDTCELLPGLTCIAASLSSVVRRNHVKSLIQRNVGPWSRGVLQRRRERKRGGRQGRGRQPAECADD